jgi:hypothetical protein
MADGAYRGNPQVIIPSRKPGKGRKLPVWKQELNTVHKRFAPGSSMRWRT